MNPTEPNPTDTIAHALHDQLTTPPHTTTNKRKPTQANPHWTLTYHNTQTNKTTHILIWTDHRQGTIDTITTNDLWTTTNTNDPELTNTLQNAINKTTTTTKKP